MLAHSHLAGLEEKTLCIFGPTACGKTALVCQLFDSADKYDIISVDSALVYKDMNIGTAKPTAEELSRYPHALVDIIPPTQSYSAAEFVSAAKKLIRQSHEAGRVPVLVGGTMLYFRALLSGMDALPKADAMLRAKLEQQQQAHGTRALHQRLLRIDAPTANRLQPTDTQRIIRALEVFELTGMPLSTLQTQQNKKPPKAWQLIAIEPERSWLHLRIKQRLDAMWQQGFLDEVRYLIDKYNLTEDYPAMRSVGYRQTLQYLKSTHSSELSRTHMQDKALFATRQLAKRQYTWLRKFKTSFNVQAYSCASTAASQLLVG